MKKAVLALEDGSVFYGQSIGSSGHAVGEVVFNTSMTGYQEILTDPSYKEQIVTLTYPHIGNTGTNKLDFESEKAHATGLIIRDHSITSSSWRNEENLQDFLIKHEIVAISEIDTRALTRLLRDKGAQNGCILVAEKDQKPDANKAIEYAKSFDGLQNKDLAKVVTTKQIFQWNQGLWNEKNNQYNIRQKDKFHIAVLDFGVKYNILRNLAERNCKITIFPAKTKAEEIDQSHFDGIFLSNGPGDPYPCQYAIDLTKYFIKRKKPLFGICLGMQILGLSVGAKTVKMKFGHHGANHPVEDIRTQKVYITSQNHGFAVDETTLPTNVRITHRSLFDNSLQGIELVDAPAFGFQGHPEASPGPQDMSELFDHFIELMQKSKDQSKDQF